MFEIKLFAPLKINQNVAVLAIPANVDYISD